ncbi:protein ENL-like isoform X2 [Pectinophora gossypiella]|uniref:protein ENL-like isoform X2 n=1 Tax=Pectinophora gossypiella TaxID=13191 RepID=UPI00214F5B8C|nr:protein ENL-like isoform X2 [Pectinophora gossypiella]
MTEGPLRHEKPMCVRVWLEVGHACEPRRSALGRALALDWRVWVRGVRGADISSFVHKVVFYLHPASAFVYPKRVIQEPPYEIQESGCASIEIPIHVYLKHSSRPRRIRLRYSLRAESAARSASESRCVYYDVENPSEPLWRALLCAGGEVVARTANHAAPPARGPALVVLLADADDQPRDMKPSMYKFAAPLEAAPRPTGKRGRPPLDELCAKCGEAAGADFRKQLRAAAMTGDEIARVQRLYAAFSSYEKSGEALPLPPLSDPIYRVPELPRSLRAALTSVEADLAMQ